MNIGINMKTGNKDLDKWIDFYQNPKKNNKVFEKLLKKLDKSFLIIGIPQDFDSNFLIPSNGLLEIDLQTLFKSQKKEEINTESADRIILAILNNVDMNNWVKTFGKKIYSTIENCLIFGTYEKHGISLEKILKIFIDKKLIRKDEINGVCILRGIVLREREKEKINKLDLVSIKIKELFNF
jgi:hypothetical protein